MSELTCSQWSCQSYSKACVLNSVVKKSAHTWKKSGRRWDVRSEVPLFSFISCRFPTIKPEKLWLTSTRLWRLINKLGFSVLLCGWHCSLHGQKSYHPWWGARGDWPSRLPATGHPTLPTHASSQCSFPGWTGIAPSCCCGRECVR